MYAEVRESHALLCIRHQASSETQAPPLSLPVLLMLPALAWLVLLHMQVRGYGMAADAHHITSPNPMGDGAALAMRRALQQVIDERWFASLLPRSMLFPAAAAAAAVPRPLSSFGRVLSASPPPPPLPPDDAQFTILRCCSGGDPARRRGLHQCTRHFNSRRCEQLISQNHEEMQLSSNPTDETDFVSFFHCCVSRR